MEVDDEPDRRFRRRERVRDPKEFRNAFERRRAVSDVWLVVHGRHNGLDHPRLGVTVPRKVARRAVQRNRIKRVVREAFRLEKTGFVEGIDLIVVPRTGALTAAQARESLRVLGRDLARRLGPAIRPIGGAGDVGS